MAQQKPKDKQPTSDVAVKGDNAVDVYDPSKYAGQGTEGADADSYALPFLAILQTNSPQVDPSEGKYIEGAKAGMLFNTVTNQLYDTSKKPVIVLPVAYRRRWCEWVPRDKGGGFKGEHPGLPEGAARDERGRYPLENGNYLSDTRNHFVLVMNGAEDMDPQPMVISLTSTQMKKSRAWMTMISGVRDTNKTTGEKYQPASWERMYALSPVAESNEKGKWQGWKIVPAGPTPPKLCLQAVRFHDLIVKGAVSMGTPPEGAETGTGEDGVEY